MSAALLKRNWFGMGRPRLPAVLIDRSPFLCESICQATICPSCLRGGPRNGKESMEHERCAMNVHATFLLTA